MDKILSKTLKPLRGEVTVPGDKSISHRSIMLGSLSKGTTEVTNFLNGADCNSTIGCFRNLGVEIEHKNDTNIVIKGNGLRNLTAPLQTLDVGNSGTTIRIMSGILAAQNFDTRILGDESICKRPMKRVMTPLSMMGANIMSENDNGCAPLFIKGSKLKGIHYESPIASAQVKSACLFAGLFADDKTSVTEPYLSRNHSELMMRYFGAEVLSDGVTATVTPDPVLTGRKVVVPGDISSAAYFIVAGLIVEGSEILIKNVGTNETRDGIIEVVKKMGGDITLLNENNEMEPCADILVKYSNLKGTVIEKGLIPRLIDEIPVIAVLACFAEGETVIKDAEELKVKESNRLDAMVLNLSNMGADIHATEDGMIINGTKHLNGATIDSRKDHRLAMSFAIASLVADGEVKIIDGDCVNISYPNFYSDLESLTK